jgi:hypothetical protein
MYTSINCTIQHHSLKKRTVKYSEPRVILLFFFVCRLECTRAIRKVFSGELATRTNLYSTEIRIYMLKLLLNVGTYVGEYVYVCLSQRILPSVSPATFKPVLHVGKQIKGLRKMGKQLQVKMLQQYSNANGSALSWRSHTPYVSIPCLLLCMAIRSF